MARKIGGGGGGGGLMRLKPAWELCREDWFWARSLFEMVRGCRGGRGGFSLDGGGGVEPFCGDFKAQSSFKLQLFLCSRGYAMDNLDEAQCIHPS